MNHKRGKTRRNVRCTLCTPWRWRGNHKSRHKERETILRRITREEMNDGRDGSEEASPQSRAS